MMLVGVWIVTNAVMLPGSPKEGGAKGEGEVEQRTRGASDVQVPLTPDIWLFAVLNLHNRGSQRLAESWLKLTKVASEIFCARFEVTQGS